MKQKFLLSKNNENNDLTIKEMAELDKGMYSLVYEETYTGESITSAVEADREALISTLRTPNFYPNELCADKIASGIADLYSADDKESVEIVFDDIDVITSNKPDAPIEEEESDLVEIDKLLEDGDGDTDSDELPVDSEKADVSPPKVAPEVENTDSVEPDDDKDK